MAVITGVAGVVELLARAIGGYWMPQRDESTLHAVLSLIFDGYAEQLAYEREYSVGAAGRIDFFFPGIGLGVEVKVEGSFAAVLRQLHRYAQVPEIQALMLVTTKSRHRAMPGQLNGRPLRVVWVGGQGF